MALPDLEILHAWPMAKLHISFNEGRAVVQAERDFYLEELHRLATHIVARMNDTSRGKRISAVCFGRAG